MRFASLLSRATREIGPQQDRCGHLVDCAGLAPPRTPSPGDVFEESLRLPRSPALVEGLDRDARGPAEILGETDRAFGLGATPTIHVDRKADDRASDLPFEDQGPKGRDVALAAPAVDHSGRKRELAFFVGDRESDPSASKVDAENTHGRECSDSRAGSERFRFEAMRGARSGLFAGARSAYHAGMKIYTTAPLEDPRDARTSFRKLEEIGYDGAFSFEAKHDPFLPLVLAAETTERLRLGTAIAIAFARNPMNLANLAHGLQSITGGRFILGLGSQVRPHIQNRFSMEWSHPARRMREMVRAIKAIFARWEGVAELDFRGEFYHHTLMIPAFDPGPNPFGPPPVYTGGFGPRMTEIAGEVADGFFGHPFNTRKSILENVLPAIDRGLARAGRTRNDIDLIFATLVVTADDEADFERVKLAARKQLAFYGSTPAYRPTLDCHGWGELHLELNRMSKQGRWNDMTDLIDDEILEAVAVVGPRKEIAGKLRERLDGIADGVSLTHNRAPDPEQWADVVADLKA